MALNGIFKLITPKLTSPAEISSMKSRFLSIASHLTFPFGRLIGILNLTCPKLNFSSSHHPFLGKWKVYFSVAQAKKLWNYPNFSHICLLILLAWLSYISSTWLCLPSPSTAILAQVTVAFHLGQCNSLLTNLPASILPPLLTAARKILLQHKHSTMSLITDWVSLEVTEVVFSMQDFFKECFWDQHL